MSDPLPIKGTIAYFISPTGEYVSVPRNHIATVIKDPEKFGLTSKKVEKAYAKYDEPMGLEGKARLELLTRIIRDGWIRIRRYPNRQWSITVNKIRPPTKSMLLKWDKDIRKGIDGFKEADIYLPVVVTELNNP